MTATDGRTRRAEALPPEERRRRIVEATLPLLLEHGEMVTTRLVAEAAGIAEGTIFRVFTDKDELIAAVVDHAYDPAPIEQALGAIDDAAPLDEVVTAAAALLQRRMLVLSRLMACVGPRFHRTGPIPDRPALIALFDAHRDEITVEPAVAARWLFALTMATSHPMLTPEPMPPAKVAQLFLHGVGRPGGDEDGAPC
jgi:AcrR family transcriptional regulator